MTNPLPTAPLTEPPRKLTLEEEGGWACVTFAVRPKWMQILPIAVSVIGGLCGLIVMIIMARRTWRLFHEGHGPRPPSPYDISMMWYFLWRLFLEVGIPLLGLFIEGVYKWRMYHRFGRVPLILTADHEGLFQSRLGFWRIEHRSWAADEITGIELRPVKGNLTPSRTVADLYIHRRTGWRLRYRLNSADSSLPGRIAHALAAALGCPLV
jgi:hypothetical protein